MCRCPTCASAPVVKAVSATSCCGSSPTPNCTSATATGPNSTMPSSSWPWRTTVAGSAATVISIRPPTATRYRSPGVCAVLRTRVITALVMLAVLYLATALLSPLYFALIISALVLVAAWEWTTLMGLSSPTQRVLYLVVLATLMVDIAWLAGLFDTTPFLSRTVILVLAGAGALFWLLMLPLLRRYPAGTERWATVPRLSLMGLLVLLPAWGALLQLKFLDGRGTLVFTLIGLVSIADIGAYFVGRRFGRRPLALDLSPKKSWEGFWGGMVCSVLLAAVLVWALGRQTTLD